MNPGFRPEVVDGIESPTLDRLYSYERDLLRFNRGQNLVSRRGGAEQARALIEECIGAGKKLSINPMEYVMDLGSGGGLPGLPIAMIHQRCKMYILERRARRCEFLRREVLALNLGNVEVCEGDATDLAKDSRLRGRFGWVLLKAVARPSEALGLARPFLADGGRAALFRSSSWRAGARLAAAGWRLDEVVSLVPVADTAVFLFRPG